ncbi:metalloregulator ArsR/SmtB family transcription factor [Psychroflexus sp. CAK57W]|uniref:ArsR/SmtB family transcription factor n=1 Tax=Psychroflexus curvus TaxID=2873595 RepID=UPI001CCE04B1|nr:metalloregulator ArsR/SmtB family transcription factor [Psychroflexus curvus]MBZ9627221.1 metalloregulator ArsR/SmtB family transcription factor [Psychroflexus curvus]MBZ9787215.1 metalloregulator ArsR/SmtB family transcription factor [Psychroflexus curvus]
MGVTRSDLFTEKQNEFSKIAKVFGHPARLAILDYLLKSQTCICGDLVEELGLAQATISQHLKELKNAEIIKGNIEGTSVCYCINEEKWYELKLVFNELFDRYPSSNDCC